VFERSCEGNSEFLEACVDILVVFFIVYGNMLETTGKTKLNGECKVRGMYVTLCIK